MSMSDFTALLESALGETDDLTGLVSESYCILKIPQTDRHYWSPQLTLSLEQDESEHGSITMIRGLYGPRPNVWAVFFMSYAALGILSLFAAVIGLSRIMLDQSAGILWAIPAMAAVALVLYLVAQAGQKVGAEQMFRIHHFYEGLVKHKVTVK